MKILFSETIFKIIKKCFQKLFSKLKNLFLKEGKPETKKYKIKKNAFFKKIHVFKRKCFHKTFLPRWRKLFVYSCFQKNFSSFRSQRKPVFTIKKKKVLENQMYGSRACSLISQHILLFSIETFMTQMVSSSTIELLKKCIKIQCTFIL